MTQFATIDDEDISLMGQHMARRWQTRIEREPPELRSGEWTNVRREMEGIFIFLFQLGWQSGFAQCEIDSQETEEVEK